MSFRDGRLCIDAVPGSEDRLTVQDILDTIEEIPDYDDVKDSDVEFYAKKVNGTAPERHVVGSVDFMTETGAFNLWKKYGRGTTGFIINTTYID